MTVAKPCSNRSHHRGGRQSDTVQGSGRGASTLPIFMSTGLVRVSYGSMMHWHGRLFVAADEREAIEQSDRGRVENRWSTGAVTLFPALRTNQCTWLGVGEGKTRNQQRSTIVKSLPKPRSPEAGVDRFSSDSAGPRRVPAVSRASFAVVAEPNNPSCGCLCRENRILRSCRRPRYTCP